MRDRDQAQALKIFVELGAVLADIHVVYASGKHGSVYINKDAIYTDAEATAKLCRMIARRFIYDDVETIIAPAVAGALLVQWTAYFLRRLTGRQIASVYAEKSEMGYVLRIGQKFIVSRGYDKFLRNKRVLVLEDILATGGSVRKVVDLVRTYEGFVLGAAALCNRGGVTYRDIGVPKLTALVEMSLSAWEPSECPLCKDGVPINTDVGKGREYLAQRQVALDEKEDG